MQHILTEKINIMDYILFLVLMTTSLVIRFWVGFSYAPGLERPPGGFISNRLSSYYGV